MGFALGALLVVSVAVDKVSFKKNFSNKKYLIIIKIVNMALVYQSEIVGRLRAVAIDKCMCITCLLHFYCLSKLTTILNKKFK